MAFAGRSQQKMSEETFDFVCTTCAREDKTIEAAKYCIECSGYLCKPCIDAHNRFPLMEGHSLMEVTDGTQGTSQQSRLPEFPTERCSIHKGKVVDMYCEDHDVVGCYVCIAKDHKTCPDSHIHSVPDMIDTIFKLSDCKKTRRLLKEMVLSTKAMSKTRDIRLETLANAKEEALSKLDLFQKSLEAILRKATEASKKEIQEVYEEVEKEILNEKLTLDNFHGDLQVVDDKLRKSEGNRAQHFVCTKFAQEKMKQPEKGLINQKGTDLTLSFTPNQSLNEYMNDLKGIGQVQKHSKQKNDLYKLKGVKDIKIRISDDKVVPTSYGCCLTRDDQLLVTDYNNKKLKRIDIQKMSVVDTCVLDSNPNGVCCVSRHEVAVACEDKIQFVSIGNKMTRTNQIKVLHKCYGIAFNAWKMYVTNDSDSLYIYDMMGTLLKTITHDQTENKLFHRSSHVAFNEVENRMFVGGGNLDWIVCLDGAGNYLSIIKDADLEFVDGVCVDGRGNVLAAGYSSRNVVQFSETGKKLGVVVGLDTCTSSVCFHTVLNSMFVTLVNSDVIKVFDLM